MDVKILITGDFCPINRNEKFIKENKLEHVFGDFIDISKNADLAVTNLECPLTEESIGIDKTGPCLKASKQSVDALKYAGFGLVTLANNHIMDYGSKGLKDTLKVLSEEKLDYLGAANNLTNAKKPFIFNKDGLKIGFLNYAENEFCTTKGDDYGANPLDPINNHYDIKEIKKETDFLIVIVHGGREHYQLPTPRIRKTFRFFIDSGADAVVSHHTHCFSGFEDYKGKRIFYGLGNFIFDYKKKYQYGNWTRGLAIQINLKKDNVSFELIPFKQGEKHSSSIRLLTESENKSFQKEIAYLNAIIIDDKAFYKSWNNYIKTQESNYKSMLYVRNIYLRKLMSLKYFPRFYLKSKMHEVLLLNLFKCETHREIMIETLDKKIP